MRGVLFVVPLRYLAEQKRVQGVQEPQFRFSWGYRLVFCLSPEEEKVPEEAVEVRLSRLEAVVSDSPAKEAGDVGFLLVHAVFMRHRRKIGRLNPRCKKNGSALGHTGPASATPFKNMTPLTQPLRLWRNMTQG